MAPSKKKNQKAQANVSEAGSRLSSVMPTVVYRIPYFQHQQLDPEYWPYEFGKPVGPLPNDDPDYDDTHYLPWGDEEHPTADDEFDFIEDPPIQSVHNTGRKRAIGNDEDSVAKRRRITDGRPAVAKKVTADLDSDDELIVRMKEARYLEKDIADKLAAQGRVKYNPKTIGTRWRRLKTAMAKKQDELLDADLTDWHEGDDDVLDQAIAQADAEVARQVADIQSRKWRMVADKMKNTKPVTNFSQHACQKRHEQRLAGTAKPTPESILNPSPAVLERIESRKRKEGGLLMDEMAEVMQRANLQGNGWTSKQRQYF